MAVVVKDTHNGQFENTLAQLGDAPLSVLGVLHSAWYTILLGTWFRKLALASSGS
jgi:hypothetical protein